MREYERQLGAAVLHIESLEACIAELTAARARLADALLECVEWLETRPDYTEGDAATSSNARAALAESAEEEKGK